MIFKKNFKYYFYGLKDCKFWSWKIINKFCYSKFQLTKKILFISNTCCEKVIITIIIIAILNSGCSSPRKCNKLKEMNFISNLHELVVRIGWTKGKRMTTQDYLNVSWVKECTFVERGSWSLVTAHWRRMILGVYRNRTWFAVSELSSRIWIYLVPATVTEDPVSALADSLPSSLGQLRWGVRIPTTRPV